MSLTSPSDPSGEVLDDRSGAVFVVTLVLSITATVFVLLRLASKGLVVRKLTSDDYIIVVAWVFSAGLSVSIMLGAQRGLGAPDSLIQASWEDTLKRSVYAFTVLYNPALMATKTAILILYRRMAAAHPFLRYASIATGVIVNLAGLVLTLISVFQCRPVRAGYEDIDGECVDVVSLYLSSAPINILTDLAILLLPLPILTRLRMEFKQKCALVATFVVGGFVTIVDVVRIIYLQNALREEREWSIYSTITLTTPPPNFIYHASFSLMWSAVEVNVGLMCACVLVLKPLIMRVMPGFLGGTGSRSRRESSMRRDREKDRIVDTPDSGSGSGSRSVEKEARPELSISVQHPTPVMRRDLDTPGTPGLGMGMGIEDGGLMIDFPESPKHNLSAIPESGRLTQPGIAGFAIPGGSGDEEDDGMDFFQMLASDPKCSAMTNASLRKMSMSSNAQSHSSYGSQSQASPSTIQRGRLASDAFTDVTHDAIDERDEDEDDASAGVATRGRQASRSAMGGSVSVSGSGSRVGGGSGGSGGIRTPMSPAAAALFGGAPKAGGAGEEDDESDDGGMDFFQMLAADPPSTPAIDRSPIPLPPSAHAPRRRSLVRRATVSLVKRVPGSLGASAAQNWIGQDPKEPRVPSPPPLPVQEPTQNFFDFVNMKSKTPLTQLSKKEAWWPIMFGEFSASEIREAMLRLRGARRRAEQAMTCSFGYIRVAELIYSLDPLLPLGLRVRPARYAQRADPVAPALLARRHVCAAQRLLDRVPIRPFFVRLLGALARRVQGDIHDRPRHLRHGRHVVLALFSPEVVRRLFCVQRHHRHGPVGAGSGSEPVHRARRAGRAERGAPVLFTGHPGGGEYHLADPRRQGIV